MSSNSNSKPRRDRRRKPQAVIAAIRPGRFDPNTRFIYRRRFELSAANTEWTVTAGSLCNAYGMVCTATNSTAVGVVMAARLISVEIWGANTAGSQTSTVSVEFNNGTALNPTYGPGTEVSDSSTSTAYTPYVKAKPPKRSNAAMWQGRTTLGGGVSTVTIFTINNTIAGGVVDVVCEVVLSDFGKASAIPASAISSGLAGAFAYAPLDGVGGGVLPVGADYFT